MVKSKTSQLVGLISAAALVAVTATACGSDSSDGDSGGSGASGSTPTTDVSMVLDYTPNGSHSRFFVAQKEGYYADEGVDMKIEPGSGSTVGLQALAAGTYDFAVAGAESVAAAIGEGAEIKAVASLSADSGLCVMAKSDSDIQSIEDLGGHSFGASPGGLVATLFPALVGAAGLDDSDVEMVSVGYATALAQFANGDVDSMGAFSFGEPLRVKNQFDIDTNCFPFTDVGLDLLGFTLVTTDKMIEDNPDLVKSVVAATAKGQEYAVDSPEDAEKILRDSLDAAQQVALGDDEAETALLTAFNELAPGQTEGTEGLGWGCFVDDAWTSELALLTEYAALPTLTPADVYTNDFLPTSCS